METVLGGGGGRGGVVDDVDVEGGRAFAITGVRALASRSAMRRFGFCTGDRLSMVTVGCIAIAIGAGEESLGRNGTSLMVTGD